MAADLSRRSIGADRVAATAPGVWSRRLIAHRFGSRRFGGRGLRLRRSITSLAATITALITVAVVAGPMTAWAQSWPSKPIRLVSPFPPGGGTDAFARPLSKVLSQSLNQTVLIDNRGGAGGTLGAELVAKSPADGYTFLVGAVHHAIAVSIYPRLGYELQKDLVPVTMLALVPNVVVINPTRLPAIKNWSDFQKYVTANPGKLNYASAGNGTAHHLTVEMYKTMTRSFVTHIPYRGAGPAVQDLLAGQVDFMFDGLGSSMPYIRAGKFLPLAVTGAKRSFAMPDVPTLQEMGIKGYEAQTWYAIWAPAGTPPDIVARMQGEVAKALATDELKGVWQSLGAEPGGQSSAEMARFVDDEIHKWAKVVKDSGARLD